MQPRAEPVNPITRCRRRRFGEGELAAQLRDTARKPLSRTALASTIVPQAIESRRPPPARTTSVSAGRPEMRDHPPAFRYPHPQGNTF